MTDALELPAAVPVMPLPGALLFPHALLPLYIFEPRYRLMLERALGEHRMFCVTLLNPRRSDWRSPADFHQIATVGLIRACDALAWRALVPARTAPALHLRASLSAHA